MLFVVSSRCWLQVGITIITIISMYPPQSLSGDAGGICKEKTDVYKRDGSEKKPFYIRDKPCVCLYFAK